MGQDKIEKAEKFFKDLKIKNLDIFYDTSMTMAKNFALRGIPTSILLNKDGDEFARIIGSINFNDKNFIEWLSSQGLTIYGASGEDGISWSEADFLGPIAIVLGNENKGLRRLTKEKCDQLIRIDMQGTVGSLNVSVACGVLLFEVVRQRNSSL